MNEEFDAYFDAIGLAQAFRTRIAELHGFYQILVPEAIADVFITDYVTEEEGRRFENLWFASQNFVMEAKLFASQTVFDNVPLDRVKRWEATSTGYDFVKADLKSRLRFAFSLVNDVGGELRASQENCDYLRDFVLKYLVPRTKVG